jgi:hypothetical protein
MLSISEYITLFKALKINLPQKTVGFTRQSQKKWENKMIKLQHIFQAKFSENVEEFIACLEEHMESTSGYFSTLWENSRRKYETFVFALVYIHCS